MSEDEVPDLTRRIRQRALDTEAAAAAEADREREQKQYDEDAAAAEANEMSIEVYREIRDRLQTPLSEYVRRPQLRAVEDDEWSRPHGMLEVELDPSTGAPRTAHLVPPDATRPGHAIVLEARVNGTPVTALCGQVLVPSRDPRDYPTCSRCAAIFHENTGATDGYRDA